MKKKSLLSAALSTVILFSFAASAIASPSVPQVQTTTSTKQIFTADGEILGVNTKSTTIEVQHENGNIKYQVTEVNDYTLSPEFAAIPEYQTRFADSTDTDEYVITGDEEIYANGVLMNEQNGSAPGLMQPLSDDGGKPWLCHYYDANDYTNYHFACYEDMSFSWGQGVPSGNNVQKDTTVYNVRFYSAKSSVDNFESAYDDFVLDFNAMLWAAGIAAATWETVIGLVAAGGAAAIEAVKTVDSWNDADEYIQDAYGYINAL